MNDIEQYQQLKPETAFWPRTRRGIDPGVGLDAGRLNAKARQGKLRRRSDRWCSPLPISALTTARLNFLYS